MWQDTLVKMLRAEINDLDASNYTDSRLEDVLVVSAYQVLQAANFYNNYVVNIQNCSITPDPVTLNDLDFSVLTVAKAACTILRGEAKSAASKAVMIKDGPSVLDNRTASNNLQESAKTICEAYKEMIEAYQFSGGTGDNESMVLGQFVLGPYSPGSLLYQWERRGDRRSEYGDLR